MKSKSIIVLAAIVGLCVLIGVFAYLCGKPTNPNAESHLLSVPIDYRKVDYSNPEDMARYGEQIKAIEESSAAQTNIVTVNDENITLSKFELKKLAKISMSRESPDNEIIREMVSDILVRQEAENRGFVATDSEVENAVKDTINMLRGDTDEAIAMKKLIEARGITMDDYINTIRKDMRGSFVRSKLKQAVNKQYSSAVVDGKVDPNKEDFDQYLEKFIGGLIDVADIKIHDSRFRDALK
jgi:hypothetical protein